MSLVKRGSTEKEASGPAGGEGRSRLSVDLSCGLSDTLQDIALLVDIWNE